MNVSFDLDNQQCTFEWCGEKHVVDTRIQPVSAYWTHAFTQTVDCGGDKYSVTWKTWMRREQFIEVQKFEPESKLPWRTVAQWSYINKPQPGTSQSSKIKHFGHVGTVHVVGSPFGDWDNSLVIREL